MSDTWTCPDCGTANGYRNETNTPRGLSGCSGCKYGHVKTVPDKPTGPLTALQVLKILVEFSDSIAWKHPEQDGHVDRFTAALNGLLAPALQAAQIAVREATIAAMQIELERQRSSGLDSHGIVADAFENVQQDIRALPLPDAELRELRELVERAIEAGANWQAISNLAGADAEKPTYESVLAEWAAKGEKNGRPSRTQ